MKIQDYMVESTKRAADEFFRYASKVPQDKLEHTSADSARSTLDLCREIAMCPTWAVDTIEGKEMEFTEEAENQVRDQMNQWKSVNDCKAHFDQTVTKFYDLCSNMPDEKLSDTRFLPYEGGRDFTVVEMMEYPRWNLNYHTGQVAYIQTEYGDKEMY